MPPHAPGPSPTAAIRWSLLAALLALSSACGDGARDDAQWLVGRWEVAYNPQHDDDDVLEFSRDRIMSVRLADGRVIDGRYEIEGDTLVLDLDVPKRPTQVRIRIAPDHRRLVFENGAFYEKKAP